MKPSVMLSAAFAVLIAPSAASHARPIELSYSTFFGGNSEDLGTGIALGPANEIYLIGYTSSTNFPTISAYQNRNCGNTDIFVSKISSSGSSLVYSTYLGGDARDCGLDLALSSDGRVFIVGSTRSFNFPTLNAYQAAKRGRSYGEDVCISHLSSSGSELLYSTYLGGTSDDYGYGIALGGSGEIYITGDTYSSDFPTKNAFQPGIGNDRDAFVSRLSSSGSALIYSTYIGGRSNDSASDITLGRNGEAYIVGQTTSSDFPTINPYQSSISFQTCADVFISRLSPSGSSMIYSTYFGGGGQETGPKIALGDEREIYIAGETVSTDFPTRNPFQASMGDDIDVFVSQFSSSGDALIYSTYLGGDGFDYCEGIALGTDKRIYIVGTTDSDDFPTRHAFQPLKILDQNDVFVTCFSSLGSSLVYSTYLGGSAHDYGRGIALGSAGEAYVMGMTYSTNFPTRNAYQASKNNMYDVFVSKFVIPIVSVAGDYNGDGTSDIAIFRPSNGSWLIRGQTRAYFGAASDQLVPQDYDGDGTWDIAVFKTAQGKWLVRNGLTTWFGAPFDTVVPNDYNGDGTADIAVFRNASGLWMAQALTRVYFGTDSDTLAQADYTGDGTTNIAVFKAAQSKWMVYQGITAWFGAPTDTIIPGDYNGDGSSDIAVFRPSSGLWLVRGLTRVYFGASTDTIQPADYNGDETTDLAIFRPSVGRWLIRSVTSAYYGSSTDQPITNP